MARNVWTCTIESRALSVARDLFQVFTSGAGNVQSWALHDFWLTQSSEAGDAQAELLTVSIKRRFGAVSSGIGNLNGFPEPVVPSLVWPASPETTILADASASSGGTVESYTTRSFDARDGLLVRWLPPWRPEFAIGPESMLLVSLDAAPADAITFNWGMTFSTGILPT